MDSSVSPEEEIWFLRVCHHISTGLYRLMPVQLVPTLTAVITDVT
jgi:hypothetical protein